MGRFKDFNMRRTLLHLVVALLLGNLFLIGPMTLVHAEDPKQVAAALKFLDKETRTKSILGAMHTGVTPGKMTYTKLHTEVRMGNVVKKNYFALEMNYTWKGGLTGNGSTDVVFYFDDKGQLFDLVALRSNALLLGPFEGANLALGVMKEAIKEASKNDPNEKAINRIAEECSDARRLLLLQLAVEQALKK